MEEALRLQKERERIHRWRASKRQAGNDMLTIWLPRELKLCIEDMALKRHCSPSELVEQALTTCYPPSAEFTDTVTDTPAQAEEVTEPPAPQSPPRRRKRLPIAY